MMARTIAKGAYRAMKEAGRDPNFCDTVTSHWKVLNKPRRCRSRADKTTHRQYIREFYCGTTCKEHPPSRARNRRRLGL